MTSEESTPFELEAFHLEPLPEPPTIESTMNVINDIISTAPSSWKLSTKQEQFSSEVYWKYIANELWYMRRSYHDPEAHPYEWFKRALVDDHFDNMVAYYEVVKSAQLAEEREGGWRGYLLQYGLPAPFARRDIATWLYITEPEESKHEFFIAAMPADLPLPEDATTRGVYSFFHRLRKTEDNKLEWIVAQTSDMKGNLPRWVQNMSIPGIMQQDVIDFTNWMELNYGETPEDEETNATVEAKEATNEEE
ncbi:uncharacterized protein V1518DRAFT_415872 [Limtongia smithiae]|uniref:uncharacterized protein n=1 Tax=Limtongia smithiae TaxID=1125753 RepID=UPI0034CF2197